MAELWGLSEQTTRPNADEVRQESDALALNIPDDELVKTIDVRIDQSKDWYDKERNLYRRQEQNFAILMGRFYQNKTFKAYQSRFQDNAIYEGEATIKPIAMSRLPDMTVEAGSDDERANESARTLTKVLNSDIKSRDNRNVLGKMFRHHPVYFIGVCKARWDMNKGANGDYVFDVVHPKNIVLDHTATTADPDSMDFIAESLQMSVSEILYTYPDRADDFKRIIGISDDDKDKAKKMASKVDIWEVWFKHYEKTEQGLKPVECVVWKYRNLILKKMKNPYFDYEGQPKAYLNGKPVDVAQLQQAMAMGGQGIEIGKRFRNYFDNPKKPYIFMVYDQWGEMPFDETSRVEQVIELQKDLDKRGRQITETADRARGKNVFSTTSGLKKEDIQNLDPNNPDIDLLLQGEDVSKVHKFIEGEQPSSALFTDKDITKSAIFNKMGTHSTTRGEKESNTATTSQILKDSDYGRIDELTNETINAVAEQMSRWAMHFIKLYYSEDHFRRVAGEAGKSTYIRINSDMIDDGMEVIVSASGTDKVMRKEQALQMAQMKLTDPLSFFEDLEVSKPKERAERLMMFTNDPMGYIAKYVQEKSIASMTQELGNMGGQPQEGVVNEQVSTIAPQEPMTNAPVQSSVI